MPIVTVSRMYGSGGSEIAAGIAARLRWTLLDNAVVDAVAERCGMTPEEVEAREERVPTLVERLADAMALSAPEMLPTAADTPMPPSDEKLVEVTRRVVEEAVARGPVVVVGRGAQAMLAARTDAIHVFCYASRAALVDRAARRLGVSAQDAERIVTETNRQREQFVKRYWNRSWRAHENYHLCINTEWLGIQQTIDIITRLAEERLAT
jgi:cytidylate kinase